MVRAVEDGKQTGRLTNVGMLLHGNRPLREMLGFLGVWTWTTVTFALVNDGVWMYRKLLFLVVVALSTLAYLLCFWLPTYLVMRWRRKRRLANYVAGALVAWVPCGAFCAVFRFPVAFVLGAIIALVGGSIAYYMVERLYK